MKKIATMIIITIVFLAGCVTTEEMSKPSSEENANKSTISTQKESEEASQVLPSKVMSYEVSASFNNEQVNLFTLNPGTYSSQDLDIKIKGEDFFPGSGEIQVEYMKPTSITMKNTYTNLAANNFKYINHGLTDNENTINLLTGKINIIGKDRRYLNNSEYTTIMVNAFQESIIITYPEIGDYPILKREVSRDLEEMISIFSSTFVTEPKSFYINHRVRLDRNSENQVVIDFKSRDSNPDEMPDRYFRIINLLGNATITSENKDDFIKLLQENVVDSPDEVDIAHIILMPMDDALDLRESVGKNLNINIKLDSSLLSAVQLTAGEKTIYVLPAFNYMSPVSEGFIPQLSFSLSATESEDGVLVKTTR